jgi:N-acetylmuramoyl-L-alanine amidase
MTRACFAFGLLCLVWMLPAQAFNWDTSTARGRDYVTLRSFCAFYNFGYAAPGGNNVVTARSANHSLTLKMGRPDMWLDGVHYVMSFPVELGSGDWLVSRMDVIKLFEPILRPQEIAGRRPMRGVVIDAGHGGTDNGATSRLGAEKNYTIDTAFRLQALLNDAGIPTVLTRRNDVFVDLYERAHIASMYPDYVFVSIHFNSASEEARGLETYCLSPRGAASTSSSYLTRADIQMLPGNDDDALNILLASAVHSEVIKLNPGDSSMDRGVKRARFVVIKANQLPAILVEGGFVSNRMESARVNSPGYRQALAQCIARGLIKFSNIMDNRHLSLPGLFNSTPAPPPLVIGPPPAPSGLARDGGPGPAPGASGTGVKKAIAPKPGTTSAAAARLAAKKLKKKSKTSQLAAPSNGGASGPVVDTGTAAHSTSSSNSTAANPGASTGAAGSSSPSEVPAPVTPDGTPSAAAETGASPSSAADTGTGAETGASTSSKGGSSPLGLAEPAPPKISAGADKAPAEPDEPPTYHESSKPATNAPAAEREP